MNSLIFLLFFSLLSSGTTKGWSLLTDQKNKYCKSSSPCKIVQSKNKIKYAFIIKSQVKENMRWLEGVSIKRGKSSIKKYGAIENFQGIYLNEKYQVYSMDINFDGYADIAIQASRHLREGYHYIYFIYNPKKKQFVMTSEHLPKLISPSKGKYKAVNSNKSYSLNKYYKIIPKK